jgi:oligopeptidase B
MVRADIDAAGPSQPAAEKIPSQSTIHGDVRTDEYFWLRDRSNPAVTAYLQAENSYANAVMEPTAPLQRLLYDEMVSRLKQTDTEVPYRLGCHYYYSRTEEGKQYAIHCRKSGSLDSVEELLIDLNDLAAGRLFLGLGAYVVSDDGSLLAFSIDTTGFRQYTLYIKDLSNGQLLEDRAERVTGVVWASDNKTLFYTAEDDAKRSYRLYRRRLGESSEDLMYEESDALYGLLISRSTDRQYIFATSVSSTTTEVRCLRSDRPGDQLSLLLPREESHRYYVHHHGGRFYMRTNRDATSFKVVSALASDFPAGLESFIEHRPDVTIENLHFFVNHCVVAQREDGLQHLRVIDLRTRATRRIEMPENIYSVCPAANLDFDTNVFRFLYQSFVTPVSVYDYDMDAYSTTLLKRVEVLGGYDPSRFVSERVYGTADDGTRIPISLVYRSGMRKTGANPTLLTGYGAYGLTISPAFSSARFSLLDRGVVFALAHVRGGGDLGEEWHNQGKMMSKRNSFTDFIRAAEHLIDEGYTSSGELVIEGGSAGGLLVCAAVNMRPDLFTAVVAHVPFVDVVNTMLDATLPLTVGEYLEWGNPQTRDAYEYMRSYCPYSNLAAKDYPAMLIRTAINDSQVMFWEPAKYVARLRSMRTNPHRTLLLRTNMAAGHGGHSGRYDALRELAFDYAFILSQVGDSNPDRRRGKAFLQVPDPSSADSPAP